MEKNVVDKFVINRFLKADPDNIKVLLKYLNGRIDIKNFGDSDNDILILENSDDTSEVNTPQWFKTSEGRGWTIQSKKGELDLKIKIVKDGKLTIWLRNLDYRDSKHMQLPIYIDFTKFSVNGNDIFNFPITVWHNNPYIYTKEKVNDGEILDFHFEWEPLK